MLTLVIPTFTKTEALEKMAYDFATSYKQQGAHIIICEDGQIKSKWLLDLADAYIYNHDNVGFTKNVNRGWKYALANGADYVGIVNSDTYWLSGNLNDLCLPNRVTSPILENQSFGNKQLRGSFFVVPRTVSDRIGFLDESMKTYFSDQDYADKTLDVFTEIESVRVYHLRAESMKQYERREGDDNADKVTYHALHENLP